MINIGLILGQSSANPTHPLNHNWGPHIATNSHFLPNFHPNCLASRWAQSREAFERLRIAGDPVPRWGWGQVIHMGGSINGGIQKWLVYNGKSSIYI